MKEHESIVFRLSFSHSVTFTVVAAAVVVGLIFCFGCRIFFPRRLFFNYGVHVIFIHIDTERQIRKVWNGNKNETHKRVVSLDD